MISNSYFFILFIMNLSKRTMLVYQNRINWNFQLVNYLNSIITSHGSQKKKSVILFCFYKVHQSFFGKKTSLSRNFQDVVSPVRSNKIKLMFHTLFDNEISLVLQILSLELMNVNNLFYYCCFNGCMIKSCVLIKLCNI